MYCGCLGTQRFHSVEEFDCRKTLLPQTHALELTLKVSGKYNVKPQLNLLEFDERFGVFKEFVFYDFQNPTRLPGETQHVRSFICCLLIQGCRGAQGEVRPDNLRPSVPQQRLPDKR